MKYLKKIGSNSRKAYERLKSEFEAVLKISPQDVQKKMDKALGRDANLLEA